MEFDVVPAAQVYADSRGYTLEALIGRGFLHEVGNSLGFGVRVVEQAKSFELKVPSFRDKERQLQREANAENKALRFFLDTHCSFERSGLESSLRKNYMLNSKAVIKKIGVCECMKVVCAATEHCNLSLTNFSDI